MIDASNSFNDADGTITDANWTTQLHDLKNVITWAEHQSWYQEPFALAAHSLGSGASLIYAESQPKKISLLFPSSTVLSGAFFEAAYQRFNPDLLKGWKTIGYLEMDDPRQPDVKHKRPWRHIADDWSNYDVLGEAWRLTMPVLLLVGSKDERTTPEQQKMLYDRLPADREFHIVHAADHSFSVASHLNEAARHLDNWLKRHVNAIPA